MLVFKLTVDITDACCLLYVLCRSARKMVFDNPFEDVCVILIAKKKHEC